MVRLPTVDPEHTTENPTMQRRKFVIGMGALASGTAAVIGTGAFTSVTAARDIDVEVADDASAYLRLEGTGGANSHYVTDDGNGGTLTIDLSSDNATGKGGQGVNPDAVTEIDDLFAVENQGTQEVTVDIDKDGDNADAVTFETENGNLEDGIDLDPGESATVSLEIDTEDSGLGDGDELLDSVIFNANA